MRKRYWQKDSEISELKNMISRLHNLLKESENEKEQMKIDMSNESTKLQDEMRTHIKENEKLKEVESTLIATCNSLKEYYKEKGIAGDENNPNKNKNRIDCVYCDKTFENKDAMLVYLTEDHMIGDFSCDKCSYIAKSKVH